METQNCTSKIADTVLRSPIAGLGAFPREGDESDTGSYPGTIGCTVASLAPLHSARPLPFISGCKAIPGDFPQNNIMLENPGGPFTPGLLSLLYRFMPILRWLGTLNIFFRAPTQNYRLGNLKRS